MKTMKPYHLYAVKTWGSAIVEAVLVHSKLPYEVEFLSSDDVRRDSFKEISPLQQIPALLLPNGEILTESLAAILYIDSQSKTGLVPSTRSESYARFLRWLVFSISSIYSLAPYVDHPDWYVKDEKAQQQLKTVSLDKVKERFLLMERECRTPWFLGQEKSMIDVVLTVMSFWTPGPEWFEAHCPKIMKSVGKMRGTEEFKEVYRNNQP